MCLTIDVNHLLFISYSSWEHGNMYWKDWVTSLLSHASLARLSKVIFDSKFRSPSLWTQTFKEKKQVARNPAKTGKAKQTASRGRQWTLNPTECKANSAEGKGSPATLSGCQSSQDSSSLWRARAGRDGGEPLFPPQFTPLAGGEPPAAAPGTSLRTPPWTQLGLMTSIFPGSKGFVVETLPKEPNFGFSSQTFVERLQSIC